MWRNNGCAPRDCPLYWALRGIPIGLRKKEDSMDTENNCSQLQPNTDVSNVSEQTEIKRAESVRKLPLVLGIASLAVGFLIAFPYFVASVIGLVPASIHPSYFGMGFAGIGIVLGACALFMGIRSNAELQWFLPFSLAGLVLSVAGFMLSVVLWLIK